MTLPKPNYRIRLAETIAWCLGQPLDSAPVESEEIKRRRQMGNQADEIMQRAYRRPKIVQKLFGAWAYRKALKLWQEADLESIEPLLNQLRTPSLQPLTAFDYPQTVATRCEIVEDVASRRSDILRETGRHPDPSLMDLAGGRILLYAPDDNLADGAAMHASKGFFDVDNVPPWDTWVCYADRYLVSWCPPVLEKLVTAGINVNPEECIRWSTPDFTGTLFVDDHNL